MMSLLFLFYILHVRLDVFSYSWIEFEGLDHINLPMNLVVLALFIVAFVVAGCHTIWASCEDIGLSNVNTTSNSSINIQTGRMYEHFAFPSIFKSYLPLKKLFHD